MSPDDDINVPDIESPDKADTFATDSNTRQGLAPKAPTRHSSVETAVAWVKAQAAFLSLNLSTWEIDEWADENEHRLGVLESFFPDQYEDMCSEIVAAYENAKSLRF